MLKPFKSYPEPWIGATDVSLASYLLAGQPHNKNSFLFSKVMPWHWLLCASGSEPLLNNTHFIFTSQAKSQPFMKPFLLTSDDTDLSLLQIKNCLYLILVSKRTPIPCFCVALSSNSTFLKGSCWTQYPTCFFECLPWLWILSTC